MANAILNEFGHQLGVAYRLMNLGEIALILQAQQLYEEALVHRYGKSTQNR